MANTIGYGQGAVNNTNGFGKAPTNNTIDFGEVCADSWSPETNLVGGSSFSNLQSTEYDGIDDHIILPTITLPTDFTVSMWVKATTGGSVRDQVFGGPSGFFLFGTTVLSGGLLSNKMCYVNGGSYVALTPTLRDGNWHYIEFKNVNRSVTTGWEFSQSSGYQLACDIRACISYDRVLTADETLANYDYYNNIGYLTA